MGISRAVTVLQHKMNPFSVYILSFIRVVVVIVGLIMKHKAAPSIGIIQNCLKVVGGLATLEERVRLTRLFD